MIQTADDDVSFMNMQNKPVLCFLHYRKVFNGCFQVFHAKRNLKPVVGDMTAVPRLLSDVCVTQSRSIS